MASTDKTKAQPNTTAVKPPVIVKKKRAGSCLFIGFLSIVAITLSSYAVYSNYQLRQLTHQQTQTLIAKFNFIKNSHVDKKNDENAAIQAISQSEKKLQSAMRALNRQLQTTLQQPLYQKQDWLLLKARYYLELAQVNAHWSSDQEASIALLQQADALLATASEQEVLTIRQAIAKEITMLQALPKIDMAGLLSQLDAAQDLVSQLPIKRSLLQPLSNKNMSSEDSSQSTWENKFNTSMKVLEKLVVIQHNNRDLTPLLSPFYQAMLRENIRFNLQETQWALLQNNPAVYQLSLTQALKNVKKIFDENTNDTQSLIDQLQALRQQPLTIPPPLINESLPLLNQFIESKDAHLAVPPTTTQKKEQSS